MSKEYTVKAEYINKQTGERFVRVYPFASYTNNMSFELKQVLTDVENMFFRMENFKDRDNWSDESKEEFAKIRKRLLNNINNISRLPDTLCCDGNPINSMTSGEMIANIINKM